MLNFHPSQADRTQRPLLMESLFSDQLWVMMQRDDDRDGKGCPQTRLVTFDVPNNKSEQRRVILVFTRQEYIEEYKNTFSSPYRERLVCMHHVYGKDLLKRLVQHKNNIVIDHGHDGLILHFDEWHAAFERYAQGSRIALHKEPSRDWCQADPDDFPVWRDRLTSLLHNIGYFRMAWLLWVPAIDDSPRQLCLVTDSFSSSIRDDYEGRILRALPFLATDLMLPPLAYLPMAGLDGHLQKLPRNAMEFYGDELKEVLTGAPNRASWLYRDE